MIRHSIPAYIWVALQYVSDFLVAGSETLRRGRQVICETGVPFSASSSLFSGAPTHLRLSNQYLLLSLCSGVVLSVVLGILITIGRKYGDHPRGEQPTFRGFADHLNGTLVVSQLFVLVLRAISIQSMRISWLWTPLQFGILLATAAHQIINSGTSTLTIPMTLSTTVRNKSLSE